MTKGLIMFGVLVAVWLIGCALVWWRSPKARERVSGPRLLIALLISSAFWVVVIPSINLLMGASEGLFGNEFVLCGLLMAAVIALDVLTKSVQTMRAAYAPVAPQPGDAQ